MPTGLDAAFSKPNAMDAAFPDENTQDKATSWAQKIASSPPAQFALGSAKRWTWPADIASLLSYGGALDTLAQMQEDAYEAGQPFDMNTAKAALQQGMEYFPTQSNIEKAVGRSVGVDLAPQGELGTFFRRAGNIYGIAGGGSGAVEKLQSGIKSLTGAGVARGIKSGLTDVDDGVATVPGPIAEAIADIAGVATGGGVVQNPAKLQQKQLSGKQQQARELAEKYDLRKFRGLEKEKLPEEIKVSEGVREQAKKELQETSTKAVKKVVSEALPIKKLADKGVDLKAKYVEEIGTAEALAKDDTRLLDTVPIGRFIDRKIENIVNKAPVPSTQDEVILKLLKRERDVARGSITYQQMINQYRNWNANTAGIWRKPEFAGAERETIKIYEDLKSELRTVGREGGNEPLMDAFDQSNATYTGISRLNQTEAILDKVFEKGYNPETLSKVLKSKNSRAYLQRNLGDGAVEDLENIAKYGNMAKDRIFNKIPKVGEERQPSLGSADFWIKILLGTTRAIGKKVTLGATEIPSRVSQYTRNRLIMSPRSRHAYGKFMKDLVTAKTSDAMERAAERFGLTVKEDIGSPAEILQSFEKEIGALPQTPSE
jgi:hypothetical protein